MSHSVVRKPPSVIMPCISTLPAVRNLAGKPDLIELRLPDNFSARLIKHWDASVISDEDLTVLESPGT